MSWSQYTYIYLIIHLDARRYFKQSEIVLFRQAPENMPLAIEQNKQMAVS